jgi:lantibiotic modifying enzyme
LRETVAAILASVEAEPRRATGLYNGLAGIAWLLAETGDVLGDPSLIERGRTLLNTLPTWNEMPDVVDGTAGLGLAAIRLHLATGDRELLRRVDEAANRLRAVAIEGPGGWVWPSVPDLENPSRQKVHPGYAWGLSGVAYFLLCATHVTGQDAYATIATETLAGVIGMKRERDGRRWWPTSQSASRGSPDWVYGAAGIGGVMLRAFCFTGDERYRAEALDAVAMVCPTPRNAPLDQLQGIAGIGDFLLDVADLLGEERGRADAWEIARTIYAQRIDRRSDGHGMLFPDEDGFAGADLLNGTSGVAAFLLRLINPGSRLLMLDELLTPAGAVNPGTGARVSAVDGTSLSRGREGVSGGEGALPLVRGPSASSGREGAGR